MKFRFQICAGTLLALVTIADAAQTQAPARPTAPMTSGAPGAPSQNPRDAQGPVQTSGTGIIRGRVIRLDSGQPLRKVRVTLRATGLRELPTAMTDDNGRYELKALPAARYTLSASRGGFVALEYGQRRPNEPGRPIELAEAQVLDRVDISLPPGGVLSGRVFDDAGEPVSGAVVQALRQQYVGGRPQAGAAVPGVDVTDDLGQFRLFGVAPGTYFIKAAVSNQRSAEESRMVLPAIVLSNGSSTFYPGTSLVADAQPVQVEAGSEVPGLSFSIVSARLATVSGLVVTADGRSPADVTVSLAQSTDNGGVSTRGGITVRPDGSFAASNVPAGKYSITARVKSPTEQVATAQVSVDGADVVVPLTLSRAAAAHGRFTFETPAARAAIQPSSVRISMEALDSADPAGLFRPPVSDDWTFEQRGLFGRRRPRVTLPQGWAVKSIRHAGMEITDGFLDFGGRDLDGIEVLLTQRLTTVTGVVSNDRGQNVTDATVVVFADDRDKWGPQTRFLKSVRPDQDGRFRIQGLPAARYQAVAVEFLESGEETNPDTLDRLRLLSVSVTLTDGETKAVDLKVSPAP